MILLRRGLLSPKLEDMNINSFITDTLLSGSATKNIALSEPVDLTKAAIILLVQTSTINTSDRSMVRFDFVDDSTVKATRADGTSGDMSFQLLIVEFPKAISIQFFSKSYTGASTTQAISTVDGGTNRVIFFTSSTNTDQSDIRGMMLPSTATLTNDSLVTLNRGSGTGFVIANFFVIELPPL